MNLNSECQLVLVDYKRFSVLVLDTYLEVK